MNPALIAQMTYELVRSQGDRLQMAWEDDRSRLLQDNFKLMRKVDTLIKRVAKQTKKFVKLQQYVEDRIGTETSVNTIRNARIATDASRGTEGKSKMIKAPSSIKQAKTHGEDCDHSSPELELQQQGELGSHKRQLVTFDTESSDQREQHVTSDAGQRRCDDGPQYQQQAAKKKRAVTSVSGEQYPSGKCVEVTRGKDKREALSGFSCAECARFYAAMEEHGIVIPVEQREASIRSCSHQQGRNSTAGNSKKERKQRVVRAELNGESAAPILMRQSTLGYSNQRDNPSVSADRPVQSRGEAQQRWSRHRGRWSPEDTPEDFWNLSMQTPDHWK